MRQRFRRGVSLLLLWAVLCGVMCSGCGAGKGRLSNCQVLHEEEFGGVYICCAIEDFNKRGFACGDSVDIAFSNGYTLTDLPYYNGYYTANGEPLLVAYPGYPYIKACINSGEDLYTAAGLKEGDKATVTLRERGKYADIQNARDIHYEDEREKFPSDEAFANFRFVKAGDIREGVLCRAASPCDNQHNRAPYVDKLISGAGVAFVLNLADNEEKILGYLDDPGFDSPYFRGLYESGAVDPIALNMNFSSAEFMTRLADGLAAMAMEKGPYLVHCTEGKDRTGFVCMLLEALCGAGYREIADDYMITYDNYYGINEAADKSRYDVIVSNVLDPMLRTLVPEGELETADLAAAAEGYLTAAGMSRDQINRLKVRLTGDEQSQPLSYGDPSNWAYFENDADREVDVFLICPTVDTRSETNSFDLNDKLKGRFLNALNMERGIFDETGRLYSPYYRQMSIKAYNLPAAEREKAEEVAYRDVSAAFRWYLDHENGGRPIILAGFSQGGEMCLELLKEYYGDGAEAQALRDRLIAVYALGWMVTEDMVGAWPQIVPAAGETDTGTVISFDCEDGNVTGTIIIPADGRALSINPLNWKTDGTPADRTLNHGAVMGTGAEPIPELCGGYIGSRGQLVVTDVTPEEYPPQLDIFPAGSYHVYDYMFFFTNLKNNVAARTAAWTAEHAAR